jgi:hypothetical protein
MNDSLDADCRLADAKEDHLITHGGQSRIGGNFRPEPINLRLFGDFLDSRAKQTDRTRCVARAILCDVFRNLLDVARY